MQRYIGLDAHASSCTLVVLTAAGKKVKELVVETHGEALVEAIRLVPGRRHLVLEEGTHSAWLHEILERHVQELVVVPVRRSKGQKSDSIDAQRLAEALRTGAIEQPVFKAPRQFALLRDLARGHYMLVRDVVRVQTRVKSVFRSRGVSCPGKTVYGRRQRDAWLAELPPSSQVLVSMLLAQYDALVGIRNQAERELLAECKQHAISEVLRTVPGLGPIRVARLLPVVVTPHRFRSKRQFWSYCGFGVVMRSSADWEQQLGGGWKRTGRPRSRGLNHRFNHGLKDVFKGAAQTVLTKHTDEALCAHYARLCAAGTKPNLAKLTIARKIAAITLAVWKNKEAYDSARLQAA
jgi:transposase